MTVRSDLCYAWMNVAAYILMVVVTYLASHIVINDINSGEIPYAYPILTRPVQITFRIWAAIFIFFGIFIIYQLHTALRAQRIEPTVSQQIGPWFILAAVSHVVWIFLWHYEYMLLALLAMIAILYSIIQVYMRLDIGMVNKSLFQSLMTHLPFSVYLSWTSFGLLNMTATLLVSFQLGDLIPRAEIWACLAVMSCVGLGLLMLIKRHDPIYPVVMMWALYGIHLNHTLTTMPVPALRVTTIVGIVVLLVALGIASWQKQTYLQ